MSNPNDDIALSLGKLRNEFADRLPLRLTEMSALICSLRHNWNQETVNELFSEAHSLAGAGGTFGLQEVSNTAKIVQNTLRPFINSDKIPETNTFSVLEQLMTELAAAITAPALLPRRDLLAQKPELVQKLKQTSTLHNQPIKILVADDDPFGLEHLRLMLEKDGHEVITAENGEQALELFKENTPDLVILDVIMPVMNGLEAATAIKIASGSQFTPIMFLSSLESDDDLVNCIEAGGDDFLSKPLNFVILRARIHALQRITGLYTELAIYHERTEEEIRLSKHVFDSITKRNSGNEEAITIFSTASGHFSGDIVCYQQSDKGSQYLLIGDFTGHGLIAALGAIPVTDVFYTMARHDFNVGEIAHEINRKLKLLLPVGRFMAAGIFKIDPQAGIVEYWFGGLPPAMLRTPSGKVELLKADKLALGIIGGEQFDRTTSEFQLRDFNNILLYSDGLTEASNSDGQMLGEEAVIDLLESLPADRDIVEAATEHLKSFCDINNADDDITLVDIHLDSFRS